MKRAPQPQAELHRQRPVEAVGGAKLLGDSCDASAGSTATEGSPGVMCTSRKHTSATLMTIGIT